MTIHHTYASSCSYYDPGIFIERWVFERSSLYEGTAHCLFFFFFLKSTGEENVTKDITHTHHYSSATMLCTNLKL